MSKELWVEQVGNVLVLVLETARAVVIAARRLVAATTLLITSIAVLIGLLKH